MINSSGPAHFKFPLHMREFSLDLVEHDLKLTHTLKIPTLSHVTDVFVGDHTSHASTLITPLLSHSLELPSMASWLFQEWHNDAGPITDDEWSDSAQSAWSGGVSQDSTETSGPDTPKSPRSQTRSNAPSALFEIQERVFRRDLPVVSSSQNRRSERMEPRLSSSQVGLGASQGLRLSTSQARSGRSQDIRKSAGTPTREPGRVNPVGSQSTGKKRKKGF
jgi:hypothetical protein